MEHMVPSILTLVSSRAERLRILYGLPTPGVDTEITKITYYASAWYGDIFGGKPQPDGTMVTFLCSARVYHRGSWSWVVDYVGNSSCFTVRGVPTKPSLYD